MNKELWKPVVGYEGWYEVSNKGRVRSLDRTIRQINQAGSYSRIFPGRILQQKDCKNTMRVSLYKNNKEGDNKGKSFRVHRIVLEAFVGPRPPGLICCHKDGDYHNNRLGNIHWSTHKQNALDSLRDGTFFLPYFGTAKLTPSIAKRMRNIYRKGFAQYRIAEKFGVSVAAVRTALFDPKWIKCGGVLCKKGQRFGHSPKRKVLLKKENPLHSRTICRKHV